MVRFRRSFCETWRWCIGSGRPRTHRAPGAEDDTKSWQGEVDVGVRVCFKMRGQFGFKVGDLAVELDDDAHRGTGGRGECGGDRRGSGELCGAQCRRDVLSADIDVALAPSVFEGGSDF
jgi:hypothetical protein